MKNLGTILSIIALAGVAYLMVNQNSSVSSASQAEEETKPRIKAEGGPIIAFVKSDSLLARYELHQEYKSKLEAKAQEIDAALESRTKLFQENVADFEKLASTLTPQQIQQTQMELQQLQQNILQYRDERSQELAIEEQELTALIKEDMDSILAKIQAREGYDFIFSYDPASELLATNPAYDITDIVVKDLNEAYQNKKAAEAKK